MEKAVYTHRQMMEMIQRTRSWTLNSPSGILPYIPAQWRNDISFEDNIKAMNETLPPYKKPHPIIKFLIWIKLI